MEENEGFFWCSKDIEVFGGRYCKSVLERE